MFIFPAGDRLEAEIASQIAAVAHTAPHMLVVRQTAPRIADLTAVAAERRTVDPCFVGCLR